MSWWPGLTGAADLVADGVEARLRESLPLLPGSAPCIAGWHALAAMATATADTTPTALRRGLLFLNRQVSAGSVSFGGRCSTRVSRGALNS